jgi:hypothetical protein
VNNIVKYGLIAFVLFYVVTNPQGAADIIDKALGGLSSLGNGVSEFVTSTAGTL